MTLGLDAGWGWTVRRGGKLHLTLCNHLRRHAPGMWARGSACDTHVFRDTADFEAGLARRREADDGADSLSFPPETGEMKHDAFSSLFLMIHWSHVHEEPHVWLDNIPFFVFATFWLCIHQLMDIWVVSVFWLLWIMLPWTSVCKFLFESLFPIVLDIYLGRIKYRYMSQHERTLDMWCSVKEPRHKRQHILWVHFYEVSTIGKSTETGSGLVVSRLREVGAVKSDGWLGMGASFQDREYFGIRSDSCVTTDYTKCHWTVHFKTVDFMCR